MSYLYQQVVTNQILTAAIYNQTENSIRDHQHGLDNVSSVVVAKSVTTSDSRGRALKGPQAVNVRKLHTFATTD